MGLRSIAVQGVLLVAVLVGAVLLAIRPAPVLGGLLAVLGVAAAWWIAHRSAAVGVFVDDGSLVCVGLLVTRRCPLARVDRVVVEPGGRWQPLRAWIKRTDGGRVPLRGLSIPHGQALFASACPLCDSELDQIRRLASALGLFLQVIR